MDDGFYADLPTLPTFADALRPDAAVALPDDWLVVVTDIEGSTAAVQAGRFRDVNVLGASTIAAVRNAVSPRVIPYVFGGDGATLCIPASVEANVKAALLATQEVAEKQFGMRLRVGLVPQRTLREQGHPVRIAKHAISANCAQAAFNGGGLQLAERLVKAPDSPYRLQSAGVDTVAADFNGLECRWEPIASPKGEVVTLLVVATRPTEADRAVTYAEVQEAIVRIYGDETARKPVQSDRLRTTLLPSELASEARLRTPENAGNHNKAAWGTLFKSAFGRVAMAASIHTESTDWGSYRASVVQNSDYCKFDDLLREVLAGGPTERAALTAYLDDRAARGELVYGLHVSDTAIMTCLVFDRSRDHVHFVDGAAGGYTMAAAMLKSRIAH